MFKLRQNTGQAKRKVVAKEAKVINWNIPYRWLPLIPLVLIAGLLFFKSDQLLPVKSINIAGSFVNLDQKEIESTVQKYIGEGFFSLDIKELQLSIQKNAWTEAVSVRRVWPDQIKVIIVEKKPLARWDDQHLLSDRAKVFLADTRPFANLPLIHAANHQPDWVLKQFHQLQSRLNQVDERLLSMKVDSRGAMGIELLNGLVVKLGRSEIDLKIERLLAIYESQILPRRDQIKSLDFRYSNGLAVAWKKEVLQGRDKASIWSNSNV